MRSTARANRLLVLSTRIDEALVSTAGATMNDRAPSAVRGSVIFRPDSVKVSLNMNRAHNPAMGARS
jgi:hypothetical protein